MFFMICKTELTVHVFSKGLVYFFVTILWFLVFFFFYLFLNFCVLAIPRRTSAFDFSLKSYMVNFLSHFSEMEKLKDYTDFRIFFQCSSYCLLFIAV